MGMGIGNGKKPDRICVRLQYVLYEKEKKEQETTWHSLYREWNSVRIFPDNDASGIISTLIFHINWQYLLFTKLLLSAAVRVDIGSAKA